MKCLLPLCLILTFQLSHAQTPVSPSAGAVASTPTQSIGLSADKKAVLITEKERFEAQVSKNYAVLDKVLANDLVYIHSNGNSDTKRSYIQSILDGKSTYDAIDIEEQYVRIYGNTAIINGLCMVRAVNNGEAINTRLKYTSVYVRIGKQWQMAAWQSIRVSK